MVSDLAVGDAEQARLTVTPADNTTQVTLEVRPPGGAAYDVPMTAGSLEAIPGTTPVEYTQTWTSTGPVVYTVPGRHVLHFTVTGTGQGAEDHEVYVVASPVAGGPAWTPGRSRVANYIPRRTLVRAPALTGSKDQFELSFTSETIPTGVQTDRLIADGVACVSARVTPMHVTSQEAAAVCASLYAAAMIERNWPEDDQALQRANDMEKRLDRLLDDLAKANTSANDDDLDQNEGFDIVYPVHNFPVADPRWDCPTYW